MTPTFAILLTTLAAAEPIDHLIDRLVIAQGAGYVAARDDLRARAHEALPVVDARLREAREGDERMTLLAARAWLVAPDACAQAYDVEGLKPDVYLRARSPIPLATRDLSRLPNEAKPVLFEMWLKTRASYPFANETAYPASAKVGDLRAAEQQALAVGMLFALGSSDLRDAHAPLASAVRTERDPAIRRAAAQALGRTHDARAVSVLDAVARTDRDESVRLTAVAALGAHRSQASLALLTDHLQSKDVRVRDVAATALATLGSSWTTSGVRLRAGAIEALRAAPASPAVDAALRRLSR